VPQRTAESKSCPKNYVLGIYHQDKAEDEVDEVDECFRFKDTPTVTWINIERTKRRIFSIIYPTNEVAALNQ
jgi:hypothetical protein